MPPERQRIARGRPIEGPGSELIVFPAGPSQFVVGDVAIGGTESVLGHLFILLVYLQPRAEGRAEQAFGVLSLQKALDTRRLQHPLRHLGVDGLKVLAYRHELVWVVIWVLDQGCLCHGVRRYFASYDCRWKVMVPQNRLARICTAMWWAPSVYQIQILPRFFTTPSSAVGCTRMV